MNWKVKRINTKVRGVTYDNRQEIIRKRVKPGQQLGLDRETDNPVDPNAIAVYVLYRELFRDRQEQIGYISKELVEEIDKIGRAAGRMQMTATVKEVTGGSLQYPTRGVNIVLEIRTPASD